MELTKEQETALERKITMIALDIMKLIDEKNLKYPEELLLINTLLSVIIKSRGFEGVKR